MKKIGFIMEIEGGTEAVNTVARLEAELDKVNKAIREAKKNDKPFAGLKAEQIDLRNQLKETNKEIRDVVKNFEKQQFPTGSIVRLEQEYSNLRKQIRELSRDQRESTFGQDLIKQSRELKDEIREVSESFGDTTPNIGNYEESIRRVLTGQSSLRGELSGFVGSLGPTAIFGALAAGGGKLIQLIGDVTKEFTGLRREVEGLTKLEGIELDSVTTGIRAISETFEQPFDQVLVSVNALTNQLTGDFQESLRLVEQGFLTGANGSDEFLDILKEYPTFFDEAGFSGEQFLNVINSQVEQGVFSDKGVDTIKEANERLRDLSQTAIDGLQAIGLTSDQITQSIQEDGIAGAIALVSEEISKLEPDSREAFLAIDGIFGSPGLDAGFSFISSLQNINEETKNYTGSLTELQLSQQEQLQAEQRLADAQNTLSRNFGSLVEDLDKGTTGLKAYGFELLNTITNTIRFGQIGAGVYDGLQKSAEDFARRSEELNKSIVANGEEAFRRSRELLLVPQDEIDRQAESIFGGSNTGGEPEQIDQVTKSFEGLKREQKELRETISTLRVTGQDYTDELERYNEITKLITGANNLFNKSVEKTSEVIEMVPIGSITAITSEISAIQEQINLEPNEDNITVLVDKLVGKQGELERLKTVIEETRNRLEAPAPAEALAPLGTLAPQEVEQTEASSQADELEAIERRKNRRIQAASEAALAIQNIEQATSFFRDQESIINLEADRDRLMTELTFVQENADEKLRIETELNEKLLQIREANNEKELSGQKFKDDNIRKNAKETAKSIIGAGDQISQNFEKFLTGQERVEKAFLKSSAASFLTAIENRINLILAEVVARQIASQGFAGILTGAALTAIVKGGFALAKSKIKGFATGGLIEGENIPTRPNGDNVVITARTGEVVLNEDQQQAIQILSGNRNIFAAARVPGFNTGGVVGGIPQVVNPSVIRQQEAQSINSREAREEAIRMQDDFIEKFEEAQNRAADRMAELLEEAAQRGVQVGTENANLENERNSAFRTQNNL